MKLARWIAAFLLIAMLLSMLPVVTLAADTTVSVSVNSKPRHTVCTSLSANARAYYTGEYRYETLKSLQGVDSTDSYEAAQNNPLFTRLHTLMSTTRNDTTVVYSGTGADSLASYWRYTDAVGGKVGYQYFYADLFSGSYGTDSMQREHIWPQSKASYFQLNGGADLHHLRPSIGGVNQSKSNRAFADLVGTDTAYTSYQVNNQDVIWVGVKDFDKVLDVRDNVKGDVARILLYIYVRWEQPNLYSDVASSKLPPLDSDDKSNNGIRVIEDRATLLRWCRQDPVNTWEMERNDLTQDVQGNRNVFIDYPELAWYLFGLTPPSDMQTPSGDAQTGVGPTVQAVSGNPDYGTVSVSGNVITAAPKDGCYVAGYEVTSGTASVAQDGNLFTVTAQTDCTVRIDFARNPTVQAVSGNPDYGTVSVSGNVITAAPKDGCYVAGYEVTSGTASVAQDGNHFTVTAQTDCTVRIDFARNPTVQAVSGNPDYGTVSVSGNVITAAPKDGCYVAGYGVTSGTASVAQDGNLFTVTAQTDCTVRIDFAERMTVVRFAVPEGVQAIPTVTVGAAGVTLPTPSGSPADTAHEYTFTGWVAAETAATVTKPTALAAGTIYHPDTDCTLYPLYSYTTAGTGTTYRLVTTVREDWSGSYVIVNPAKSHAMNSTLTSGRFGATAVSITNDTVANPAPELIFVFDKQSDGRYSVRGSTGYLKIKENNTTAGAVTETVEDTFAISRKTDAWQVISSVTSNRCFSYYGNNSEFRTYAASIYKTGYLYRAEGTADVTTYLTLAPHVHTLTAVPAKAATCTEAGNEAYWTCTCGKLFSDAEGANELAEIPTIPALCHGNYTYTNNGDGTHKVTCGICSTVTNASEAHTFVDGTCACGAKETADPLLDKELGFYRVTLSLESYIGADFIVRVKNLTSYSDFYVVFEYPTSTGTTSEEVPLAKLTSSLSYATHKVAAKEMTDVIKATLYAKGADGKTYHGETVEWSVRSAMQEKLNAITDYTAKRSEVALCAAILNYGAAAQNRFSYKTEDLANNILTPEQLACLNTSSAAVNDQAEVPNGTGVTFSRMALSADSTICVNIAVKLGNYTADQVECRITYPTSSGSKTVSYTGQDITKLTSSTSAVVFELMAAKQLREKFTVTFYEAGTDNAISPTMTYSMQSYIATSTSTNQAQVALLNAVLAYGDAAADYFKN